MKHSILFLLFLFLFCASCQHKINKQEIVSNDTIVQEPTFRVINFTENLTDCGKPLLLSDIVDGAEYIKLETTETGYIAEINDIRMSDKYIALTSFMVDHALLFDRATGRFIRAIGKVGQGPGEMLSTCGVGIQDSIVYLTSSYISAIFAYKATGEFIKKIPLRNNVQAQNMNFIGDYIIHYPGSATFDGLYVNAYIQDWNGSLIAESTHQFPGKFTENLRMDPPRVWTYRGIQNVYSLATDTVYAITKDSIYPRYYIPEGKYKRKVCDVNTQVDVNFYLQSVAMGSMTGSRFAETTDFLLFSFNLNQKYWFCRYNKKNSEIDIWKQEGRKPSMSYAKNPKGITNDIDGCTYSITKLHYIDDRHFVLLITSDNIDEIKKTVTEATNVKLPEKRNQLLKLIDSMGQDDNPILAIYKLKD